MKPCRNPNDTKMNIEPIQYGTTNLPGLITTNGRWNIASRNRKTAAHMQMAKAVYRWVRVRPRVSSHSCVAVWGVEVAKEGEAADKSGLEVKKEGSHVL